MTTPDPASSPVDSREADPVAARDFLIRSEEQLHVSTQRVPAGVARLEKFVVTETKTITVQVSHEEVRLVHEPADGREPNPGYHDNTGLKNQARWMYVSREEVVVTKKMVPLERVRLEVYPVTEQRDITEQIRKEQIDPGTLPIESPAQL